MHDARAQGADGGPTLICDNVDAGWGTTHVLSQVSLALPAGETIAVLGRNGVGKTTLLSAIAGRAQVRSGGIWLGRTRIDTLPIYKRVALGLALVPQEREIFPSLSVEENLLVASRPIAGEAWTLPRVYDLFPRLYERRRNGGAQLSGGEQQMLSIGRALMCNPSVLLMDEPMEGLAPVLVDALLVTFERLKREARLSVLLVEQHVDIALELTNRVLVLDRGVVAFDGAKGITAGEREQIKALVGVDAVAGEVAL